MNVDVMYAGQKIGSVYLNGQFTKMLEGGKHFLLSGIVYEALGGQKLLGSVSISAVMPQTAKDESDSTTWTCSECGCGHSEGDGGWWKCCPDHTPQNPPSSVLCKTCAYKKHPDWTH